jgi:N-acetylneuraminic acid mutarotase
VFHNFKNDLYVIGGDTDDYFEDNDIDIFTFNKKTKKWKYLKTNINKPKERCGEASVLVNNLVYFLGGVSDTFNRFKDFWVLDLERSIWKNIKFSGHVHPLFAHSIVSDNINTLYVFVIFLLILKGRFL